MVVGCRQEVKNRLYAVFRKTGFDPESGLHYNLFRYYDSEIGRYISVDPARSGLNFYAYCNANPLNFADPYGLCGMRDDPMGMAGAFGQGLGQGGLNLLQGIQDVAVGTANLGIAANNPAMLTNYILNGPMFSSPNWTRDLLVTESDSQYAIGTGLIDSGLVMLQLAVGTGELQMMRGASGAATKARVLTGSTRGGINPVLRGQAGVARAIRDIEAQGGTILGREITLEAGAVRTRPDLYVRTANGQNIFVEVKTGNGRLTPKQNKGFPVIRNGGAIPRGLNAERAGLKVCSPLGPTPVQVIHYP